MRYFVRGVPFGCSAELPAYLQSPDCLLKGHPSLTIAASLHLQLAAVFRLDLNTLQTAVSFFDRILSLVYISSKQLQVCGLAALYFATKVLETAPFRAEEIEKYFSQVATPQGELVCMGRRSPLRARTPARAPSLQT